LPALLELPKPKTQTTWMQIFENKGAVMGCSNPHPHSQAWTSTGLPEEIVLELAQMQGYREAHNGAHMLQDYALLESQKNERIVFENEAFIAVCPWWAIWPFETMIISKQHCRALVDLDDSQVRMMAEAIESVTKRYDNLFKTKFPYSKFQPGLETCSTHRHGYSSSTVARNKRGN
jgi:UDPglucose--hexose-1-phosphate uridylyltransferase